MSNLRESYARDMLTSAKLGTIRVAFGFPVGFGLSMW